MYVKSSSTKEVIDLKSVSSSHAIHQLITDLTHILPQSFPMELILIDQPNLVTDMVFILPSILIATIK